MITRVFKTGTIAGPDVAQANNMVLSTVDIPDPGFLYQLTFTGQIWISPGTGTGIDVTMKDGATLAGTNLSVVTSIDGAMTGNQGGRIPYPVSGTTPVLGGARSVSLCVTKWKGAATNTWTHSAEGFTSVTVLLTAT